MEYEQKQEIMRQPRNSHLHDYNPALNGIGGWLILIIIGRFLTIILGAKEIVNSLPLLGYDNGLDIYIYIVIAFSIISNVILSGLMLYYIFIRNILFRKLFVLQIIICFVFYIASYIYVESLGASMEYSEIFKLIISAAIWIPYLYKSVRVKNTFIYHHLYKDSPKAYDTPQNMD